MEQHRILNSLLEVVPYQKAKPIKQEVVDEVCRRFDGVTNIDDLHEVANAFWNYQAKRILMHNPGPWNSMREVYDYLRNGCNYPEYGVSVTEINGKEYVVYHKPRKEGYHDRLQYHHPRPAGPKGEAPAGGPRPEGL